MKNLLKTSAIKISLALLVVIVGLQAYRVRDSSPEKLLIPLPAFIKEQAGEYIITPETKIVLNDKSLKQEVITLQETFTDKFGSPLRVVESERKGNSAGGIVLKIEKMAAADASEPGEYSLDVTRKEITITASTSTGIFYGIQTLRQLIMLSSLAEDNEKDISIKSISIIDEPRFQWRGVMLDPARYFLPVDLLKKYISSMAFYKLNRLQLHLTDDLGWTVEMIRYPELNRQEDWPQTPSTRNRGMYTRQQLKDLVTYAAERHITIIPELELPGHNAIVGWVKRDILCPTNPYRKPDAVFPNNEAADNHAPEWMEPCVGNEQTLKVYENILGEFMEIFPSEYIHIGGDEYYGHAWASCPDCQRLVSEKNLNEYDSKELQDLYSNCKGDKKKYLIYRYLMTHLANFVSSEGRTPILWDDLSWRSKFPEDVIIMQWHYKGGYDYWQLTKTPQNPAFEAASSGRRAVISPFSHLYFDLGSTLKDVYLFDPIPEELTNSELRNLILGPHAPVWNQPVDAVFSKSFPRFYALSEIGWAFNSKKDFEDLKNRVRTHVKIVSSVTGGELSEASMME